MLETQLSSIYDDVVTRSYVRNSETVVEISFASLEDQIHWEMSQPFSLTLLKFLLSCGYETKPS